MTYYFLNFGYSILLFLVKAACSLHSDDRCWYSPRTWNRDSAALYLPELTPHSKCHLKACFGMNLVLVTATLCAITGNQCAWLVCEFGTNVKYPDLLVLTSRKPVQKEQHSFQSGVQWWKKNGQGHATAWGSVLWVTFHALVGWHEGRL